jgi:hypothetical protein
MLPPQRTVNRFYSIAVLNTRRPMMMNKAIHAPPLMNLPFGYAGGTKIIPSADNIRITQYRMFSNIISLSVWFYQRYLRRLVCWRESGRRCFGDNLGVQIILGRTGGHGERGQRLDLVGVVFPVRPSQRDNHSSQSLDKPLRGRAGQQPLIDQFGCAIPHQGAHK